MMKKSILIIVVLTLCACGHVKKSKQASPEKIKKTSSNEIHYNLDEIDVVYIPDYKFKNVFIDRYLDFAQNDDLRSTYNGNVRRVTEYYKLDDGPKKFYQSDTYDKEGYIVQSRYGLATHTYLYDAHKNLIKEANVSEGDTTHVLNLFYNKKNQLIRCTKKYLDEPSSSSYNWLVTIKYDPEGRPYFIENIRPEKKYSYQKELKYDGNCVSIFKIKDGNARKTAELVFSENDQVVKELNQHTTLFDFFNSDGLTEKRIVFESDAYERTITYEYDEKGNVVQNVVLNYQDPTEIIESTIYKYDDFGNITYEKYSYNHKNDVLEKFFEFEYYD